MGAGLSAEEKKKSLIEFIIKNQNEHCSILKIYKDSTVR